VALPVHADVVVDDEVAAEAARPFDFAHLSGERDARRSGIAADCRGDRGTRGATRTSSSAGMLAASSGAPNLVRIPRVAIGPVTATGTPASAGRAPCAIRAVHLRARAGAPSGSSARNAQMSGSSLATASDDADTLSTALRRFARTSAGLPRRSQPRIFTG
jgi:hypothetical protein